MIQNNDILKKSKILIVDDIPDNIKLLGQILKSNNVSLSIATNGQQAVNTANKVIPDLILMDISMPVMDGLEATKLILTNETTKHIPIIFLTAMSEVEDTIKGFELGAVDYIVKPFNPKILLQRIKTHLTIKFQKDQIIEKNKKLIIADTEKNKFLSIIAHDLKSPFAGILGLMKILVDEYDTLSEDDKKDFIASVNEAVNNQYEFLENLLAWSKIQFGKTVVHKTDFNLKLLLDKIYGVLKLNSNNKKIKIKYNLEVENIFGDVNLLYSVFHNLITNSIKFTPEGGSILIKSSQNNDKIIISVRDTGVGMSEKIRNSLFKIDEIRSTPGTNSEPGTGLGLLLCKEIVEQHKGEIFVESQEGKGTEFIIELPIN